MSEQEKEKTVQVILDKVMAELDRDNSGLVNLKEVMDFMEREKLEVSQRAAEQFIKIFDDNHDQMLSKEELRDFVIAILADK
ncbi:hypothetical protein Ciccas_012050 [Cichlidogyrus casuarinus]|uniref:EF-hand domain-containing protein n=1 Tax=Cichlidogyrus casuarinus TaxID=1844966 RepID=A0ABD2PPI3_9PLAT